MEAEKNTHSRNHSNLYMPMFYIELGYILVQPFFQGNIFHICKMLLYFCTLERKILKIVESHIAFFRSVMRYLYISRWCMFISSG